MKKAIRGFLLVLLACLLAALALHPWVVAWVGSAAANASGRLDIGAIKARGYGAIELEDVRYRGDTFRLAAGSVRLPLPLGWLVEKAGGGSDVPAVSVDSWQFETTGRQKPPEPEAEAGVQGAPEAIALARQQLKRLRRWLPSGAIDGGRLLLSGREIGVPLIRWDEARLEVILDEPVRDIQLALESAKLERIGFRVERGGRGEPDWTPVAGELALRLEDRRLLAEGTGQVVGNPFVLDAAFPAVGWVPDSANLRAESFETGAIAFRQFALSRLAGDIAMSWADGGWESDSRLEGALQWADMEEPQPVEVALVASGDLESARFERVRVQSPFLETRLTQAVEVGLVPVEVRQGGTWEFDFTGGRLPAGFPIGALSGSLRIATASGDERPVSIQVQARAEGWRELYSIPDTDIRLKALVGMESLRVESLEFVGEGAGTFSLSGEYAFSSRRISGLNLGGEIQPGGLSDVLPDGIEVGGIRFEGSASGTYPDLDYEARATAEGLSVAVLRPLDTGLRVSGTRIHSPGFALTARTGERRQVGFPEGDAAVEDTGERSGEAENGGGAPSGSGLTGLIQIAGGLGWEAGQVRLRLDELIAGEAPPEGERITLSDPSVLRIERGPGGTSGLPAVEIEGLAFDFPNGHLLIDARLAGDRVGPVRLTGRGIELAALEPLLAGKPEWFGVRADDLDLAVERTGVSETIVAAGNLALHYPLPDGKGLGMGLSVATSPSGIELRELSAAWEGDGILSGQGKVPLRLVWTEAGPVLQDAEDAALRLSLDSQLTGPVTDWIAEQFGVHLDNPAAHAAVAGTLEEPLGEVSLRAAGVSLKRSEEDGIQLGETGIRILMTPEELLAEEAFTAYQGQRVQAQARLPMGPERWASLALSQELPPFEEMEYSLTSDPVPLSFLARFFPQWIGREGTVSANVEGVGTGALEGSLTLANASTAPLPNGAALRNADARLVFTRSTLAVESFQAVLGGQPLSLGGEIDFTDRENLRGSLTIMGENLPLARQENLVIRGDVDLGLSLPGDAPGEIAGRVTLRDSFMTMDLASLMAPGTRSAASRPPYFSVEGERLGPIALAVEVRGERFLRVDSALFKGAVSSDFVLEGTLGEPQAIGQATIPSGSLVFPFGTLAVSQGSVRLTRDSPYEPRLNITARGQTFGYEITANVTGTGSEPKVEFSSSPPLSSDDILLLLTSGRIPESNRFTGSERTRRVAMFIGRGIFFDLLGRGGEGGGIGERLRITSGQEISEEGRETMRVEFRINEDWSVIGEYDRFDDYNLNLMWEVYER